MTTLAASTLSRPCNPAGPRDASALRPMLMLVARPAFILLAQGLTYLLFLLLDVPERCSGHPQLGGRSTAHSSTSAAWDCYSG